MRAVFDTTVLIDQLNSVADATEVLGQYEGVVSSLTVMEILAAAKSAEAESKARELLSIFEVVHTNDNISEQAAALRKDMKLTPPNAIIYATAKHLNCLLITSNSRDFSDAWEGVKIPYRA